MSGDAAAEMKTRLRADLRVAMKHRRPLEAKVIRALVAAIDNAEAPPIHTAQTTWTPHDFDSRAAEVERLLLSWSDVRNVILADIQERERAAAELERLNEMDRAEALRAEALVAARYLQ
ncbi:hypothetical protein [Bradyrhizobium sp. LHD-71]|uniref:hypothetical protein n=1 Tax=Bradyrhizobium sp. LHD-71 TaxID=3072141 RepID=UPI00280D1495|nr:hypothetical protein [Bradyrhizobium sp. LHD-71]MDQ8730889.1 hypothetical protein [Bradyrhizobium sp. LHD-71]